MFMLYLPSSKFSCYSNCSEDSGCSGYWYSSEGSTSTHDRNTKTRSSTYTYMQTKANAKTARSGGGDRCCACGRVVAGVLRAC